MSWHAQTTYAGVLCPFSPLSLCEEATGGPAAKTARQTIVGRARGFTRMAAMATDDDEGGRMEGEGSESEGSFDQDSILTRSPHPVLCASYQRTQSWPAAPTEQAFTVKPLGSVLEDEHVFASETFGRRPSESMRRQVRSTERKAPPMSVLSAIAAGARGRSVPLAR